MRPISWIVRIVAGSKASSSLGRVGPRAPRAVSILCLLMLRCWWELLIAGRTYVTFCYTDVLQLFQQTTPFAARRKHSQDLGTGSWLGTESSDVQPMTEKCFSEPIAHEKGLRSTSRNALLRGAAAKIAKIGFADRWRPCRGPADAEAIPRRKHRPARGTRRSKAQQSQRLLHIVVDGLETATDKIRLVPETRSAGVAQKIVPPFTVRLRTRPRFERREILPVLPHAEMHGKERIDQ